MAIDPTTTTTIKVGDLQSAAYSTTDLIPHEVGGYLKKGNLQDLATFIGEIIDVTGGVGFRAVEVNDGETLPATEDQEFILVGPGTFPNVGGGATITTTEPLNALVSNGTYWFIGVEIPITATGVWGTITGVLSDQTDLNNVLVAKADLVDGKVPNTQLPSYVDDVVEVANFAALPATGETGKIYVTIDTGNVYRWSGSAYIRIADESPVWGIITGDLEDQTDLQNALNGKYPVPTGDTTQYIAGDGTLITFPVAGQAGTLVRLVRNNSGATITKGSVVYINGASGNNPTIAKAIATGDSTSAQTFGLVQADITNNSNGYVVVTGDLIGVNTSAIAEGSQLYLSSTTAGAYTTTKQLAPAHLVYIGVVTRSHATLGQIEVKIQNGYELDELHDVAISSKTNNQVLVYESSTDLWKNKSLGTILGGISSQFVKGDGSLDSNTYALDSVVVKLTGDQSISGVKTFSTQIKSNILLINESGGFSGATGYTQLGGTADYFQIVNGGGSKQTKFIHTGVRNITMPASDGTMALTSDIPTVSGTTNYIPKFTGASAIGNSLIFDNGTNVGIGTVEPGTKLDVRGNINIGNSADTGTNSFVIQSNKGIFQIDVDGATSGVGTKIKYTYGSGSQGSLRFVRALDEDTMILAANGNVGIGTTSPDQKLTVEGNIRAGGVGNGFLLDTLGVNYTNGMKVVNNYETVMFSGRGSSGYVIAGDNNLRFGFGTNYSAGESMRITSGGKVGIGESSPFNKLTVNYPSAVIGNSSADGVAFQTSNTGDYIQFLTNLGNYSSIQAGIRGSSIGRNLLLNPSGGNVGIGTTSPSYQLQLSTDSAAKPTSALWTIASDERIKENINSYTKGLNELLKINPITYDYNGLGGFKKGKGGVGIIAQEIAEILPDSVSSIKGKLNETDEEEIDILNFNGHELTYILINAVKELKAEIEILKNK